MMGREVKRVPPINQDAFWALVDRSAGESGCWPWTGRVNHSRDGRGVFDIGRQWRYAHRVAWLLTHGSWPTPQANHHCDNTICCNPAHMYAGTQAQNVADCEARHRRAPQAGSFNGRAKLTADQVREILSAYVPGSRGERSASVIGRRFGVHRHTIQLIGKGELWAAK